MAKWYLGLFNIDHDSFVLSRQAIIIQGVAALAAPLLAALWPVLKGAGISVREAIASYGLGADFGSGWFDRAVERAGARLLPAAYAAALGNMFRRKARLALTLAVLAVAGAMFLVIMSLVASIQLTLDNDMARRGYDIRIGFTRNQPATEATEAALGTAGIAAGETWVSHNATLLREGERLEDSAGLGAQLQGVPSGSTVYRPIITEGRWLAPGDERSVVISAETAGKNGIEVGDEVTLDLGNLGDAAWRVIGTYRVVYDTGFLVEPIYAPLDAVYEATGLENAATVVYVSTADAARATAQETADDLKERFESEG